MPANHTLKSEVQQVLDELWNENLLPFKLDVGKITKASDDYTIHFHDSRMHTAVVVMTAGQSFREAVRSAVLDRVEHLSGPLKNWKTNPD